MTSPVQPADQLVPELAGRFAAGVDAVLPPGPLALVDFPDHSNVGDSAIWLGEMAYLRARARLPAYHSALGNHDDTAMRAAIGDGAILIHGGGNFGTLWPRHEAFRLHLLRSHKGRPIVQMPQSIHYAGEAGIAEMAGAIREHGNFTLLVRDARSLAFAQRHFDCRVALCPDAALMLGRQRRAPARVPVMALLRTDHERAGSEEEAVPPGVIADDWLEEDSRERRRIRLSLRLRRLFTRDPQAMRLARQQMLAQWRLARGLAMLSQGEAVVTDRLHAHILSLLLDIPHVLLDNSYGKVRGFAEQWTGAYAGLSHATTRREAIDMALQLRRHTETAHGLG
ncbi:polysaccharide pyruvyl transferase family protein [Sphingomonas sp. BT-65]|uniref:polysaccharide pyruvyl transferase family protein n=1 Tax=Sphingomonas sp. BT-65 TaxID=2989821 RepID=UPI002235AA82|nr:polysaccharide pyruvyl transferase family protein [Sphingomonas sp. BT-65]MCW4461909.1 polysaccharide pyruvyl transferase family protein [Sphingomonas sp. BT-65]